MSTSSSFPLAYSSNGFTQHSLIESLSLIASCGYRGVELLGDRPHWTWEQHSAQVNIKASDVRKALDDLNLVVSNVNGNTAMFFWPDWIPETLFEPALSSSDIKVRQSRVDSTKALLDWSAEVGGPVVSVTSGRCPGPCPPQDHLKYFCESIYELCEYAETLGIKLSIEYEPGLLVETSSELLDVIHNVQHPVLGANLDLGHAQCAGEDVVTAIRRLQGKIHNIHVEDIQDRKHYHLVPGQGNMDLKTYFEVLRDIQYQGMYTVELYTYASNHESQLNDLAAAQQAYQYLHDLLTALE